MRKTLIIPLVCIACTLVACIDSDYDLSNIETDDIAIGEVGQVDDVDGYDGQQCQRDDRPDHLAVVVDDETFVIPSFISLESRIESLEQNVENVVISNFSSNTLKNQCSKWNS